ncbi:hypothetical protein SBI67_17815 [Mycolicibacterium sp. 120266]|uniref:hypothetical protein n=1 Tax=Mycolicibacterium sp. 120266 TaxID=3090601 RepID=UPI00299D3F97|nr:hypothetical protein [Mycolicibacterium sp. 120266]MDX1873982.1 hypothetical protein [Mycolicibacterium sp. 120266]
MESDTYGIDGTDEDQAYIDQHRREAEHLRSRDEGEAEVLTEQERLELADKHDLRADDREADTDMK